MNIDPSLRLKLEQQDDKAVGFSATAKNNYLAMKLLQNDQFIQQVPESKRELM